MDRRKIALPVGSLLGHEVANRGNTLKNAVVVFFPRLLALDSRQNRSRGEPPCFMEFLEDLAFPLAGLCNQFAQTPA